LPRLPRISNDLGVVRFCKSFKVVYEPFFHGGGREIRPQRFSVEETLATVENAA